MFRKLGRIALIVWRAWLALILVRIYEALRTIKRNQVEQVRAIERARIAR